MSTKNLRNDLDRENITNISTAFDIIGNKEKAVAIVEIPDSLKKHKRLIAEAIMKKHKNIKTVLEKKSPRKGLFRIRSYRVVLGDRNTEAVHKESGCFFKLDPRKVYFSTREGTERIRVCELVNKNERIMVFFAGIGAFPIIIAKKGCEVYGIEVNPKAVAYFKENIKLNKVKCVVNKGDVKRIVYDKNYKNMFDRVFMPLPESSVEFLKEAVYCLKSGGICHLYCFLKEDEIDNFLEKLKNMVVKQNRKFEFVGIQKVLPWGPKIYKYRVDFKVC